MCGWGSVWVGECVGGGDSACAAVSMCSLLGPVCVSPSPLLPAPEPDVSLGWRVAPAVSRPCSATTSRELGVWRRDSWLEWDEDGTSGIWRCRRLGVVCMSECIDALCIPPRFSFAIEPTLLLVFSPLLCVA